VEDVAYIFSLIDFFALLNLKAFGSLVYEKWRMQHIYFLIDFFVPLNLKAFGTYKAFITEFGISCNALSRNPIPLKLKNQYTSSLPSSSPISSCNIEHLENIN